MPLDKQTFPISFAQGLDTKSDPKQVAAGKFLLLQNCQFGTQNEFTKRNGNIQLSSLTQGNGLATFKNELVSFDGSSGYSYNPATASNVNKGPIQGVELAVSSIYRSSTAQTQQDSAYNSTGDCYLFVWNDSSAGAQYIVVSGETGQQLIPAQTLSATATRVRAWSLGLYLLVTYVDTSNNHLVYIAIPALTPGSPGSATDFSTTVNASNPNYDGVVASNSLYLAWNASDGGGAVRINYITSTLIQPISSVAKATENANTCITVFADTDQTVPNVWVAYCNTAAIKYFVVVGNSNMNTYLAPTSAVTSLSGIQQISGYASLGSGKIYYQKSNTYSFSTVRTDIINQVSATDAGVVGSASILQRGAGIVSKVFSYGGHYYFVIAFGESLQPTYFLINETANIVAKLAYTNGGGYATAGLLTNVNSPATGVLQFAYLFKDLIRSTSGGNVYTQTGVNSVLVDFASENVFQSAELGQSLNINGGFLQMYDGYGPVEQNFHVFPETIGATGATGGSVAVGTYSYIPLYEWTDNQGNTHQSGYGTPLSIALGASGTINVAFPTLRLTQKKAPRSNVSLVLYRTTANATSTYYRVTSITSPTLNDTTVDSVTIADTSADASITGNELLYTTGAVVQNTGAPSFVAMNIFKNRLMGIDAEDRNRLWYSKQVLEATPVEMSDAFTQYIDPSYGGMTALAKLDDKEILFKYGAIYYMTGDGPDATGSQNDFSDAIFITSVVGTNNPKSIALTPDGLMFQSPTKGIWLLDRGLSVSYIGAPVEAYNSDLVTSAQLIPNSNQVRFTLDNGIALVYDYYYRQWGTYTNHSAVASVLFENLFTFISSDGNIFQESPNLYSDNGQPVLIGGTLSWLSLAGLQGYQRAYRIILLGEYLSPHILNVSVAYDYNASAVQQDQILATTLDAGTYGDDPFYGSSQFYGGADQTYQWRLNLNRQKCQSIQISFQEQLDPNDQTLGAGLSISAMSVVAGVKKGQYPRLPATRSVTS